MENIELSISKDIANLCGETEILQVKFKSKFISNQQYQKQRYLIGCKAGYLKNIVEEAQKQGVEIKGRQLDVLDWLASTLLDDIDLTEVGEISKKEFNTVNSFVSKYKDFVDEDDLADLIN